MEVHFMARRKFEIHDRVVGNDKRASFRERTGIIVDWLPSSSEYGVRFDDRAQEVEYVYSVWLDQVFGEDPKPATVQSPSTNVFSGARQQ
jgi:hypothetical protein